MSEQTDDYVHALAYIAHYAAGDVAGMKYTAQQIAGHELGTVAHMIYAYRDLVHAFCLEPDSLADRLAALSHYPTPPGTMPAYQRAGRAIAAYAAEDLPLYLVALEGDPDPLDTLNALCDLFTSATPAIRTEHVLTMLRQLIARLRATEQ
jgi:hypothetical protein